MISNYYLLIPLLPLIAFVLNILFGKKVFRTQSHWISILAVGGSFILSLIAFTDVLKGKIINQDVYTWITSGSLKVSAGFLIDPLTAVMIIVVTTVSLLVHIYSVGYMHGDRGYHRFFSYLSLFTFSMLMLVMANNFLQLYFGWEAVGLCSYFLIGYWHEKKSASDAGKKAFIVNRFGDFGFGLGIIVIFLTSGSLHYDAVFRDVGNLSNQSIHFLGMEINAVTLIALLLFCGAVGKSAQLPLHVWLPDAMEGPTPVSALIHAATMVTAGVFMVARANPIFNLSPIAMDTVALVGGVTALFAATIALVQNDIKRIIAYSTVSQLGYMFMACGVGAYGAGIFHLFTHAFFKALLFLCAGSVMHAMGGEVDAQRMGGLRRYMPITYLTMLLASLSISGMPGFAGFFSKDDILWRAFSAEKETGKLLWILGTFAAFLTAFYSFRLLFLTFHGEFRGTEEEKHHLHESPKIMTIPLLLLCAGAVLSGYAGVPHLLGGSDHFVEFLSPVLGHPRGEGGHALEGVIMGLSVFTGVTGILLALLMYRKRTELPLMLSRRLSALYRILLNKYYVDEFYDFMIVKPSRWAARYIIHNVTDSIIIEGIVNGLPAFIGWMGLRIRRLQSGIVSHYSMIMAGGFLVIIAFLLIRLWQ